MDGIDPSQPIFRIFANGKHVATLFDPRFDDMFWCSYTLQPVDADGDAVIHDGLTWERVAFVVEDMNGHEPNPNTFSGGFRDYCERKTDRLSFRSLWPPRPPKPSRSTRFINAITRLVRYNPGSQNSTEQ